MKTNTQTETELAAYRELSPTQQLDAAAARIVAEHRSMDLALQELTNATQAEAARRLGQRMTTDFQQMIAGQGQTTRRGWGAGPQLFPRRVMQLAAVGLSILLLAAAITLFSTSNGHEMTAAATATISAVGGVTDQTVDESKLLEPVQPTALVTITPSITITFGCESWSCSAYEETAKAFHQRYPELAVITVPIEQYVSAANAPDTDDEKAEKLATAVDTYVYWPLEHAATARYVHNLAPLIDADPNIDFDDFYPNAFYPFQWDGATWALPSSVTPALLFYNQSLFDEKEIPYPTDDWSQSDFLQAAMSLTQIGADGAMQFGFADYGNVLRNALAIDSTARGDTDNWPSTAASESITWYTDLALKYNVMPIPPNAKPANGWSSENRTRILHGEVAMWTDYLSNEWRKNGNLASTRSMPVVGIAPLPVPNARGLLGWQPGYFLSKKSNHVDESWLWLKFLSERYVTHYGGTEQTLVIPARRTTTDQSGYWKQWDPEERQAIEAVLENPALWPTLGSNPWWLRQAVEQAMHSVFTGQSVAEAMEIGIVSPVQDGSVADDVPIIGRATHESFDRYELFYKKEADGDDAYVYFGGRKEPVELGQLGVWKTDALEQGSYTLRMRVVRATGDYADYFVHNVQLTAGQPPSPQQLSQFAYGIAAELSGSESPESVYDAVRDLNFTWVKHDVRWATYQPSANIRPQFSRLLRNLTYADDVGLNALLNVSGSPSWASALDLNANHDSPPVDPELYAAFLGELADATCQTSVKAIEVWGEQNMSYAWGDRAPNPQAYIELLRAAHAAIKKACPSMLVISGGLTPAGQNPPQAVENLLYMDQLLTLGLTDYVDGIGVHLPGYNVPPSADLNTACAAITADDAAFRGPCDSPHHSWSFHSTLDEYRALLAEHGVTDKPLWVTEFGWPAGTPVSTNFTYVGDNSHEEQAEWTLEAFAMMAQMPEVGPAFLSNLNASVGASDSVAAQWSILDANGQPLPVYNRLRERNR